MTGRNDRRTFFGPTNRGWTGAVGQSNSGASRMSFREPGGTELPLMAELAERQVSDSRFDFKRREQAI